MFSISSNNQSHNTNLNNMKYKIYHIHHHFFIIVFWSCIQLQIFQRVKLEEKKNGNYLVINQAGPEDKGVSSYNLIPYLKMCLIFCNTANPLMNCQFFFSFKIKKGLNLILIFILIQNNLALLKVIWQHLLLLVSSLCPSMQC